MSIIPHTHFHTKHVATEDRYDIFRDSISVLFEVDAKHKNKLHSFHASIDAYLFDQTLIAKCQSKAADYIRTRKKIQQDGNDSIMIQLFLEGGVHFSHQNGRNNIHKGDIVLFDLAKPADNFNTDFMHLSVLFPRELIESSIPGATRWHGLALPRHCPVTQLLRSHIMSLHAMGANTSTEAARGLQDALIQITSSALQTSSRVLQLDSPTIDASIMIEVKKFICQQLANPKLSIDLICERLGLSRSQLYRISEPIGGIANFIKMARLNRAYSDLRAPQMRHLSIADISQRWGFNNVSTFARNIKNVYGCLPKDLRHEVGEDIAKSTQSPPVNIDRGYEEWVKALAW